MSSLAARARQAMEDLDRIEAVRAEFDEHRQLKELVKEMQSPVRQAMEALEAVRSAGESGMTVQIPSVDAPAAQLEKLASEFEKNPTAASLRNNRHWKLARNTLAEFVTKCQDAQSESWRAFLNGLFAAEGPEQLRDRVAPTPENMEALERYEAAYRAKAELERKRLPHPDDIGRARTLEAELELAYGQLDFDVPDQVKTFFNAAASSEGAPLSLLTPDVIEWLQDNALLDRFSVRNRNT